MMDWVVQLKSIGSISPLGHDEASVQEAYAQNKSRIQSINESETSYWAAKISQKSEEHFTEFIRQNPTLRKTDRTVQLAVYASDWAVKKSGWNVKEIEAINIGSSRGATELWEEHFTYFLLNGRSQIKTSPLTTLGNISSHVANFFQHKGIAIDHSMTCSSGLLSVLNGLAWLQSGLCQRFIAGASEAPITPFTIAQMRSLGIYSNEKDEYPCKSLDLDKKGNTMVLGEGAVAVCMERKHFDELKPGELYISGWGSSKEIIESVTGISLEGRALGEAMESAVAMGGRPDVVIAHAPGTVQGDMAEWNAISSVFGPSLPWVTSTKWTTGHLLGCSGLISLELGYYLLHSGRIPTLPYIQQPIIKDKVVRSVMINSIGFGGNAVSLIFAIK
jgi:3-oxoacyl-(acyl-carrier-protein) synthase